VEEAGQQLFVERPIGVGDERPRHAIDPRQPGERLIDQYRQVAK